ncbi:zinc finger protein 268-like [Cydia amplana]|uniref:zinc finger protein 268-like n=1 Tax=Cydia amplana TaxID=1869771 RepID=UPI002FE57534
MAQIEDPEFLDTGEYMMKRSLLAKSKRAIIVRSPAGSTEYRCVECPLGFNEKADMEQHLAVHNQEYRFLCGICGTALKRKEHLDRHTLEHKEVRPHICPDCGKGFKRKEHLNIHRTIHSGEKNHVCPLCDKSFYRKDHLQKHLQTHNKMFIEQNIYPVSDQELLGIKQEITDEEQDDVMTEELLDIKQEVADEEQDDVMTEVPDADLAKPADPERPHLCPICHKGFKRKDHLKLHSVSHLARDKLCPHCGKGKLQTRLVPDAGLGKSADPERPHMCPICHKGFKLKYHLKLHSVPDGGLGKPADPERPHMCPICHKGFKLKYHLKLHSVPDGGLGKPADPERPHMCPICHKGFKLKYHLKLHSVSHLARDKLCPHCGKGPRRGSGQVGGPGAAPHVPHLIQGVQAEIPPQAAQRQPSYAHTAGKVSFRQDLFIHATSVTSHDAGLGKPADPERPHMCPICHKGFKRKDHLKLHSVSHLARDKLCPHCGKAFRTDDQLQNHMITHVKLDSPASEEPYLMEDEDIQQEEDSLLIPRVSMQEGERTYYSAADERPYSCKLCGRRFKRKQHLKVHANVHARNQPPTIWCSICSEGFFNNSQFESHECMGADPEETPTNQENNYPAQDNVEIMNIPIVTEEPEPVGLPVPRRVFVCKFCGKPFKRKDHYRIHLHVHTGVKSFFCEDCGKGFYRKDHLQKHSQVHSRTRPQRSPPRKPRKEMPELFPIHMLRKPDARASVTPEITITAPSNTKLRVPLQIKVPYQVVTSLDNGEQRVTTVDPRDLLS